VLVLRRKVGETIVLTGDIKITVLAIKGEWVRIGVSAPPEITIMREEVLHAPKKAEGKEENSNEE